MDRDAFQRRVLEVLNDGGVPTLVGGSHALVFHTGLDRPRRDLDLMLRREHWPLAEGALRAANIECRLKFPHWIGKATCGDIVVDLLFNSGNGLALVDDGWFLHATPARLLGMDVLMTPREELIWSKAFVMERERFDGGDVLHLLGTMRGPLDWARLLQRFIGHEPVLLAHLVLFTYVYPGRTHTVPGWIVPELMLRAKTLATESRFDNVCRGTLLSRAQYLTDVVAGGLDDARRPPYGNLTDKEVDCWTMAIDDEDPNRTGVHPVAEVLRRR